MRPSKGAVAAFLVLALGSGFARAQQSNFQISPPPVPYPYFEPGRMDLKLTGTALVMTAPGVDFHGGGLNGAFRKALGGPFALDAKADLAVLGGTFDLGGTMGTVKPVLLASSFGAGMELQLVKGPGFSLLAYGGLELPLSVMTFDKYFTVSGKSVTPTSIMTVMFGVPVGVQAGVDLGPVKLAPFAAVTAYGGGTSVYSYSGTQSAFAPSSADISGFTCLSYGMDVIIVPWNLSIGTLLQTAASSGSNGEVETKMIQLSYHFRGN